MSVFRVNTNQSSRQDVSVGHVLRPHVYGETSLSGDNRFTPDEYVVQTDPKGVLRTFKNGEVFTDNNYWKRFAYPQMSLDSAFIEVLEDDGSVYSDEDGSSDVVSEDFDNLTEDYSDENTLDFEKEHGDTAGFLQIVNTSNSLAVTVEVNGKGTFDIPAGDVQIFNKGDLSVRKLRFKSASAGGSVHVFASV